MSAFETIRQRGKNLAIYGGITATLGAALLGVGGAAFAQEATPSPSTEIVDDSTTAVDRAAARRMAADAFLEALAVNLGVADGATVEAAIRITMVQTIEQRLADGEISADRAARLITAIESGEFPIRPLLDGRGGFGDHDRRGDHGGRAGDKHADDGEAVGGDDDSLMPTASTPTAGLSETA